MLAPTETHHKTEGDDSAVITPHHITLMSSPLLILDSPTTIASLLMHNSNTTGHLRQTMTSSTSHPTPPNHISSTISACCCERVCMLLHICCEYKINNIFSLLPYRISSNSDIMLHTPQRKLYITTKIWFARWMILFSSSNERSPSPWVWDDTQHTSILSE